PRSTVECADFSLHAVVPVGYRARLAFRRRSSVVERILGKAEVGSSILPGGTIGPKPVTGLGPATPTQRSYSDAGARHPWRLRLGDLHWRSSRHKACREFRPGGFPGYGRVGR